MSKSDKQPIKIATNTSLLSTHIKLRAGKWELFLAIMFIAISLLFLYRIDLYPSPFYDEGADLHVAKNFAIRNVYADYSSEGDRPYGPSLGTGPALLLVTGLVYKVFGVSFVAARLVVALYSLGTVVLVYLLGCYLMNRRLAALAVLLLVFTPGLSMWMYGRMAMGEMPGLFFTVLALLMWLRSESHQTLRLILTGILFGLVATTKNQFALIVLPGLVVCWLTDLLWYRQRNWRYYVIPGVVAGMMYAGWLYAILFLIAAPDGAANVAAVQGTSSYALFVWQIREGLSFLISRNAYGFTMIPALIFGIMISRGRNRAAQDWGILTTFVIVGVVFYMSSLGWPRYAFLALVQDQT